MAEYRYGKNSTFDGIEYFYIDKKVLWFWVEQKCWVLPFLTCTKQEENEMYNKMIDSVNRLIKQGHTVL